MVSQVPSKGGREQQRQRLKTAKHQQEPCPGPFPPGSRNSLTFGGVFPVARSSPQHGRSPVCFAAGGRLSFLQTPSCRVGGPFGHVLSVWSVAHVPPRPSGRHRLPRVRTHWRVGGRASQVMFLVRCGARARLAVRRGHRQNIDLRLMQALGYLPSVLVQTMELPRTTFGLARTSRAYPTLQGHVEVEEMEGRVKHLGQHYVYWCVSVVTHFREPAPSESSVARSGSDLESDDAESFV